MGKIPKILNAYKQRPNEDLYALSNFKAVDFPPAILRCSILRNRNTSVYNHNMISISLQLGFLRFPLIITYIKRLKMKETHLPC